MLIVRKGLKLEAYLHTKHIEYMNIVIMVTGSIVGVAYLTELFMSWYSGVEYESYAFINRATGPYWWAYASMMTANVLSPQLIGFKKLRRSLMFTFFISIVVNIGMWFERFVIIVTSLHQDYLPSSWGMFHPTWVDIGIFIGTIGLFFVFYLAFARYFPVLPIAELKTILKSSGESYKNGTAPVKTTPAPVESASIEAAPIAEPEPMVEVTPVAPVIEKKETKKAELSDEEKQSKISSLMEKLGGGSSDVKDDLKLISGVGPKLEGTLNDIGITSFAQVSKMTKGEYDLLDSITGTFPGRAERDNWAEQAKNLMNK
jgi:molybdopterin-containing oxidoreductase family membrane subunit